MGYPHEHVIHHHGKVVKGRLTVLSNYKIAELCDVKADFAAYLVMEAHYPTGVLEADDRRTEVRSAKADITSVFILHRLVRRAICNEFFNMVPVDRAALALAIELVVVNPEPVQAVNNVLFVFLF